MNKPLPEDISNRCFVSSQGPDILFALPPPRRFSHDEALILAAWLVSMVGDDDRWGQILAAVQGT